VSEAAGAESVLEKVEVLPRTPARRYDERLAWCFQVYDLDGSGYIDRGEFTAILTDMNFQASGSPQPSYHPKFLRLACSL